MPTTLLREILITVLLNLIKKKNVVLYNLEGDDGLMLLEPAS